ncbi:hypothetical protein [Prevotella pallens]|uniref:hypothetical protein n=1 Tax=Prevotella pallens TaxID=60133 RepID=UPI003C7B542B
MSGYGHDESAPTPGGVFRNPFRWCSLAFHGLFAMFWQSVSNILAIRQQYFGRLSAAVGADLSRPHIRIHPQNGKRKCVCGEMNVCI